MNLKVKIEHLCKTFTDKKSHLETTALDDIDLEVYDGELLCIVGPSGCGKTTLLKIIAGLETPTSGTVYVDSQSVTAPARERGLVFQEFALFPWRSVAQNVAFGLEIRGVSAMQRKEIVDNSLRLVRLNGIESKYPAELSGGMKQRVAIARALANDPGVLLMDEPFGSLDAQTRNMLQTELLRIWRETKKTIIFVTHNVDEAVFLADRIVLMTARIGKISHIFNINLTHPRNRTGEDFVRFRREILDAFPQVPEIT